MLRMSTDLSAKHEMEERKMITASQDTFKVHTMLPLFLLGKRRFDILLGSLRYDQQPIHLCSSLLVGLLELTDPDWEITHIKD